MTSMHQPCKDPLVLEQSAVVILLDIDSTFFDFVKAELKQFHERFGRADLLLLFSCMARHMAPGVTVYDEIDEVCRLRKLPLAGFFTYGEIGRNTRGKCDFHNKAFALMALRLRDTIC